MTNSKIFLLFALITIGCNETHEKEKDGEPIPSVVFEETDWGGNLKLHILKTEKRDSFNLYTIVSTDNKIPIGFKLEVPTKIKKFGKGIQFQSLGDTSDNFLKSLSSVYQINLKGKEKFIKNLSCQYAGLNDLTNKGGGQKRESSINYIKIFFEGTGEDDYAELYVNIDEPNKTVELEEKDSEYRPYIIKLLTEK